VPRTNHDSVRRRHELTAEIGRRVADARISRGVSQRVLGQEIGLPQQAIARVELGQRQITFVEALEIMRVLGLQPEDLDPRPR